MHQHQVHAKRFNPTRGKKLHPFFSLHFVLSFIIAVEYFAIVPLSKRQQHQNGIDNDNANDTNINKQHLQHELEKITSDS